MMKKKLELLSLMGFKNEELNQKLLKKSHGKIENVVKKLLKN